MFKSTERRRHGVNVLFGDVVMTSEARIGVLTINYEENLLFFSEYHKKLSSRVIKTFKFSLVLRTRENVFITLDENINGIHSKRINIYIHNSIKYTVVFSMYC